ncbi:hypothetical protein NYE69_29330 [Paenibacillus sp. FSL R5-0527]|uniref:hypothetical protein n=1 Tax=Paenibacillus sp. FSL R5-0527 TaxID=2975321 RepID=UPI0030FBDBAD
MPMFGKAPAPPGNSGNLCRYFCGAAARLENSGTFGPYFLIGLEKNAFLPPSGKNRGKKFRYFMPSPYLGENSALFYR